MNLEENNVEYVNEIEGAFKKNKPSIIDLYVADNIINLSEIKDRINNSNLFETVEAVMLRDDILCAKVKYKKNNFDIFLKISDNDDKDLENMNRVLVADDTVELAVKCKKYIKSYVEADTEFVKAYYAQIKLLSLLSDNGLLIVDCSQWCIYSYQYVEQFSKSNVDIIDSNLFKVKAKNDGLLYTEGLDRFGIKDFFMAGVEGKYVKGCASFISRLARYYIEEGQMENSCCNYSEVFENHFFACLIDIEQAGDDLLYKELISIDELKEAKEENRLFLSVHQNSSISDWYENDEDVLEELQNNDTYYTSQEHFDNEKELAQETIVNIIKLTMEIHDEANLMILARNEEISTDWYTFAGIEGDTIILKTPDKVLKVTLADVINWNYQGITPLNAYSL